MGDLNSWIIDNPILSIHGKDALGPDPLPIVIGGHHEPELQCTFRDAARVPDGAIVPAGRSNSINQPVHMKPKCYWHDWPNKWSLSWRECGKRDKWVGSLVLRPWPPCQSARLGTALWLQGNVAFGSTRPPAQPDPGPCSHKGLYANDWPNVSIARLIHNSIHYAIQISFIKHIYRSADYTKQSIVMKQSRCWCSWHRPRYNN